MIFSETREKVCHIFERLVKCIGFRFKFDVDKTSRRTFIQGFLKYDTQARLKNRHIIYVKFQRFYQRLIVAIYPTLLSQIIGADTDKSALQLGLFAY